jgi:hypothetical protein
MTRDTSIIIKAPARVRVKTFGNRADYSKEWESVYTEGKIAAPTKQKKKPAPLTYQFFEGSWEKLPAEASAGKPQASGNIDSTFVITSITNNRKGYIVAQGALDIPSDGEYVFYANGF